MITPMLAGAAALVGVLSHIFYFKHGEHHMSALRYLGVFVGAQISALAVLVRLADYPPSAAGSIVLWSGAFYLIGTFTSLLTYRIFLHPLNKFPGPLYARISSIWYSTNLNNADAPKKLKALHDKYGPFLRIGSSDLSITHPEGPHAIYGLGTKCTKAIWYDGDQPYVSLHTQRNRTLHDKRRRVWSPAFSDKALRGYESRLKPYTDLLTTKLKAFEGKPVNASNWFNYFSFDVMGDLAFGESFDMLEKGESHWAITLLNQGMDMLRLYVPMWLQRALVLIPGLEKDYWNFMKYCASQADRRIKKPADIPDIMSALLSPHQKTADSEPVLNPLELQALYGDSRLIIVAGSDTTATTLTHLVYHLASDKKLVDRLRDELGPHVDVEGNVNNANIVHKDYLNGCINEALRLHPPVPSAVQRLTPPEGITVGDVHVPGRMTVWCPQWVMGRDERCYKDALSFVPERWYSKPEMVTDKTAFAPFNAGVYGCIGKPLALLELRTVVAKLITIFDIDLAPGEDGYQLLHKSRDHFTTGLGQLNLTFKTRTATTA